MLMIEKNREYPVLDKGFIILVDSLGNDTTIVNAARVSYQKGTTKKNSDEKLINYLIKHRHSSPLEMVELQFQIKAPIVVARQWFRHRMGEFNEMSLRYSEAPMEFYHPEVWRGQDTKNKQSSSGVVENQDGCNLLVSQLEERAVYTYDSLIQEGVSREMARMVLPTNLYTTWYWKANLRSLANFVSLRNHEGAQWEIQQYAKLLKVMAEEICPIACAAMNEHGWRA